MRERVRLPGRLQERFKGAPLPRIECEVEAFAVLATGCHVNKEIVSTRHSRKLLQLPDFTPPNVFEIAVVDVLGAGPDFD